MRGKRGAGHGSVFHLIALSNIWGPAPDTRIDPAMKSLKMLSTNGRIQFVMEELGGFDRSYGKSRFKYLVTNILYEDGEREDY
jgi:hypothetical protein